jgi:hypothetical protein
LGLTATTGEEDPGLADCVLTISFAWNLGFAKSAASGVFRHQSFDFLRPA